MKNFKDKIITITGAGSGMGRAYAIEFAKLSSKLALNDYNEAGLTETINLLKENHPTLDLYSEVFDVSNKDKMFAFADHVQQHLGNTHVIINNAGIEGNAQPVYALNVEDYKRLMDINFYGVLYGTKAFLPQIVKNNEGAVVNVSSIFGLFGPPNYSDYAATKFAVRGFTEALAIEFVNSPISIHCVHPGGINTNISKMDRDAAFTKKYLSTPPETIAKYVIKCIRKKRQKIVFGNNAFKAWVGSSLLPQKLFNKITWAEMKKVVNLTHYPKFTNT